MCWQIRNNFVIRFIEAELSPKNFGQARPKNLANNYLAVVHTADSGVEDVLANAKIIELKISTQSLLRDCLLTKFCFAYQLIER